MPQDYVGYSPWTDAAEYGRGLGQSLSSALINMPQQRYQIAAGVAQMQARQQQQQMLLQMRQLQAQQAEDLRKVQMQEALARTAATQAQLGKISQGPEIKPKDTIEIIKGEGGVPMGYFDYNEKKYVPFGAGSNSGTGLGQKPPAPITQNQQYENFGNLLSKYNGAQNAGWQTNNPAIFGALSNAVMNLGRQLGAAPTNTAPQLGVGPTNSPPPFQLTNSPDDDAVRVAKMALMPGHFNPIVGGPVGTVTNDVPSLGQASQPEIPGILLQRARELFGNENSRQARMWIQQQADSSLGTQTNSQPTIRRFNPATGQLE